MNRETLIALMAAAAVVVGCASAPKAARTAADVQRDVRIADDPMEQQVVVRSPRIDQPQRHMDIHAFSVQLIAGIDRRSGRTVFLVKHDIRHSNGAWLFFSGATYMNAAGEPVMATDYKRDRGDVDTCIRGGCSYTEGGTFTIKEADLRAIVANPYSHVWRLRLRSERAAFDAAVERKDLEGFLAALDSERIKRGFPR